MENALTEKLIFKNFNFKLAIINHLMYEKKLLKPKFDIEDFVKKNGLDLEEVGFEPIPQAIEYFKELEIDKSLGEKVGKMEFWGGNEIYRQIWWFWDGECDYFDITELTEEELKQFPKLKVTINEAALTSKAVKALKSCKMYAVSDDEEDDDDEQEQTEKVTENGFAINSNGVIVSYDGIEKDLVIPSIIGGIAVQAIGKDAFRRKGLTSVVIPEGVTHIGSGAFSYNAITKVVFPTSLKEIGGDAFESCNLASITLPEKLTKVGSCAFSCNFTEKRLLIPKSLKKIGNSAFQQAGITHLTISEGVTEIGNFAFSHNELVEVILPKSLKKIKQQAFKNNKLTQVTIPDNVEIEGQVFGENPIAT